MRNVWTAFGMLMMVGTAHADVCGDANRSGSVTVTDGVLVLRNAAGLDDGLHCP